MGALIRSGGLGKNKKLLSGEVFARHLRVAKFPKLGCVCYSSESQTLHFRELAPMKTPFAQFFRKVGKCALESSGAV